MAGESHRNDMRRTLAVLIVGAGPTGLTLACELARSGVAFRLIESCAGPQPGSRGKGIQPRTLEVFEDLGIIDRVIAHGRMGIPIRSTAPDGQATVAGNEVALKDRADVPYPTALVTPQWRIEEALRLRLAELGASVESDRPSTQLLPREFGFCRPSVGLRVPMTSSIPQAISPLPMVQMPAPLC